MGVLKKKEERTETVTIRIASSVKAEIDQLRERAEATGFDLNATMSESLTRLVRQVREELAGIAPELHDGSPSPPTVASGGKWRGSAAGLPERACYRARLRLWNGRLTAPTMGHLHCQRVRRNQRHG